MLNLEPKKKVQNERIILFSISQISNGELNSFAASVKISSSTRDRKDAASNIEKKTRHTTMHALVILRTEKERKKKNIFSDRHIFK